jgi:hypothetical protein
MVVAMKTLLHMLFLYAGCLGLVAMALARGGDAAPHVPSRDFQGENQTYDLCWLYLAMILLKAYCFVNSDFLKGENPIS